MHSPYSLHQATILQYLHNMTNLLPVSNAETFANLLCIRVRIIAFTLGKLMQDPEELICYID